MKSFKHLIHLTFLAALAACGGDSSGPGTDAGESGSLRFTYSGGGAAGGTFQAAGAVPTSGTLGNWAGGGRIDDPQGTTILLTGVTRVGSKYHRMSIELQGVTTGTYNLDDECEARCAFAAVSFGIASWTDMGERSCVLEEGQVTLTSLSATEAKGTFSGVGVCMSNGVSEEPFRVTGGTFDLPLVAMQG